MSSIPPIVIYGSRAFGRVVRSLVEDCGRSFAGYIDDWDTGPEILAGLLALRQLYAPGDIQIAVAVGYDYLDQRLGIARRISDSGYSLATLVHPAAYVSRNVALSDGALVMARATIDTRAAIGRLAVIWPGAVVGHDSEVGANAFLSPGAIVCGFARIGASCFVGAGAVIADKAVVPDGSFVKAASLFCGGALPLWRRMEANES